MQVTLITGGARSGKSQFAEKTVLALPGRPVYVATAEAGDEEMKARIAVHRARRDSRWLDRPATLDLAAALAETDGQGPRLVDCLTLWLSNLMFAGRDWQQEAEALVAALSSMQSPVVLVTNEVGLGIVPDNRLAREFRDAQGRLNQMVAAAATDVHFVVCGLPMKVK
ncbi:MAG: bifunctional adenosylcobinamide kinase/adenosylcobinamide-phosphate guanylyltransferase [Notoacmeibacter sp.]|nr:bifunctional adenosylcobinamide kinase/adenosylcobinamide-phosphate guanylyltransferase [Notoacmeibacter sp.]MCC0031988.1 bifunctional adenosylcobinamide kinase/adenosylcobinamide-phosphate guanylyltransferase [Brucellaceae bacterium]